VAVSEVSRGLEEGGRSVLRDVAVARMRVIDVSYPRHTDFDTHRHDEAYLCLAVRGSYREWMGDGRVRAVSPGRALVYGAGSSHAVRTDSETVRIIHVSDPSGREWAAAHPLATGLLWQIAFATAAERDDAADLHVESLVCELTSGPPDERGDGVRGSARERSGRDWLQEMRDRIRECFDQPISLSELARDRDRHPAHAARAFRARWGITPGAYLRRIRVAAAVQQLTETGAPPSAVALDTGFADQSHLGRWMRRYTGRTPGEIRRGAHRSD